MAKALATALEARLRECQMKPGDKGHVMIQNAFEFYKWGQQSSMKEVEFLFVEKAKCEQKQIEFANLKVKAVKHTMKLHAITSDPKDTFILRTHETSCYCELCNDKCFCGKWTVEKYEYARGINSNETEETAMVDVANTEYHIENNMNGTQRDDQASHNNSIEDNQPFEGNSDPATSNTSVYDSHQLCGGSL